jgi:hypothetical protein
MSMRRVCLISTAFVLASMVLAVAAPVSASAANDTRNLQEIQRYQEHVASAEIDLYQRFLDHARQEWISVYRTVWQSRRMDEVLKNQVRAAVTENIDKTPYLERIRGIWDEEVIGKILKESVTEAQEKFGPEYRAFLNDLDKPYSEQLSRLLSNLAKDLGEVRKEAAKSLPGYQSLVTISLDPVINEIQTKFQIPEAQAPVRIESGSGLVAGAGVLAVRKLLQKKVIDSLAKRVLGAAGRKVFFVFEGPLGWAIGVGLMAHDVYTIGREIKDVPEKIETSVYESARTLFYSQAPDAAWSEELKQQVQTQMRDVRDLVGGSFDAVFAEFRSCDSYGTIASGLDEKQQNELLMKLYVLRSGTSLNICRLSDSLAHMILEVGTEQLTCIQKAIKQLGISWAAEWLNLSRSKMCDLMQIPPEYLARYEANSQNLAFLSWLAYLPEQQRNIVMRLDRDAAEWIQSLSREKQIQLLRNSTKEQVLEEMNRMRFGPQPARGQDSEGYLTRVTETLDKISESFLPKELKIVGLLVVLVLGSFAVILFILMAVRVFRFFLRVGGTPRK